MSDFTKEELAVLRELIHIAVQARGMQVAEASVVLTKKIAALQELEAKEGALREPGTEP